MPKIINKRADGSIQVITTSVQPSKTDQSFKDSVDINRIMKKYRAHGFNMNNLPWPQTGKYGDFSEVKTYQQALQQMLNAHNLFDALPSETRKRFSNDPQELIQFLSDPKNNDEAIKLGLRIQTNDEQNNDKTNANPQKQNKQSSKTKPPSTEDGSTSEAR